MPITIYPAIEVSAYKNNQGQPASPLDSFFRMDADGIFLDGRSVKDVLDELFRKFLSLPNRGWQKFTDSGDFVVPEEITRVLVMCIGAGSSTANTRGCGVMVSRYLSVTPGETIPVHVGQPQTPGGEAYNKPAIIEQMSSSFNGTVLKASWRGIYHIDGKQYTFTNSNPTFPEELADAEIRTAASINIVTSGSPGPGSGGFAVPVDAPDERTAWLQVARDTPPGVANNGRYCYPDTTQLGQAAYNAGSYWKAGDGANYGGSAGKYAAGQGYPNRAGRGGDGLVCVFWGDDIEASSLKSDPLFYRKEESDNLIPVFVGADASYLPYNNAAAGFKGTTVAEALQYLLSFNSNA